MSTTRLSTKGQLIIPKEIRDRHGWLPGARLRIEDHGDAVVIRSAEALVATTVEELLGCLPHQGPAKSLEDMDAAIAKGARAQR